MASVEHRAAHEDRATCVSRSALMPSLTPLDERVARVLTERGQRLQTVAEAVHRRTGHGVWGHGRYLPSDAQVAEVRGILRGLEHLGKATGRGGWWRAL